MVRAGWLLSFRAPPWRSFQAVLLAPGRSHAGWVVAAGCGLEAQAASLGECAGTHGGPCATSLHTTSSVVTKSTDRRLWLPTAKGEDDLGKVWGMVPMQGQRPAFL